MTMEKLEKIIKDYSFEDNPFSNEEPDETIEYEGDNLVDERE